VFLVGYPWIGGELGSFRFCCRFTSFGLPFLLCNIRYSLCFCLFVLFSPTKVEDIITFCNIQRKKYLAFSFFLINFSFPCIPCYVSCFFFGRRSDSCRYPLFFLLTFTCSRNYSYEILFTMNTTSKCDIFALTALMAWEVVVGDGHGSRIKSTDFT
jgi:hypothetical protein